MSAKRYAILGFVGLTLAIALLVAGTEHVEADPSDSQWVQRDAIEASQTGQGLDVRLPVSNRAGKRCGGRVELALVDLDGNTVAEDRFAVTVDRGEGAVSGHLRTRLDPERMPLYLLKYRLETDLGYSESGSRSLVSVLAQLETHVWTQRSLLAGSDAAVRVVALNQATGKPAVEARVRGYFQKQGGEPSLLFEEWTGEQGTADIGFAVPEGVREGELKLAVAHSRLGEDAVTLPVKIRDETKVLLNVDKPMYQPGQRIQMRALCLDAASLDAEAGRAFTFEVMDSKGNKVFKKALETSDFGIASADFQLASEVNLGSYTIRGILGETQTEKQVTVERYVLPKFKVGIETNRDYYLPGQRLEGEVRADYFFGKPVAGGRVEVVASKFEIEFTEFARVEGTLDDEGHWEFELDLPDYFAGTPLEQGKASVRLEAFVTDTASHREEKVVMRSVAQAPLTIHAVPESGRLAPGLENRVHILVAYPDGSPAAGAQVKLSGVRLAGGAGGIETDELGIVTVQVEAGEAGSSLMKVSARDKQGQSAEAEVALETGGIEDALLLRTEKALYRVGDTLRAEAFTTKSAGAVYFDLVRAGQTVMTRAADLNDGRATLEMDLDAGLSGSVAISAYTLTPSGDTMRDARKIYVNPANALTVSVELEKDTYRPGEQASLEFRVSGEGDKPVPAALGITIVDESVYALQEIHPGLEKVYFTLEREIMQPRYEIHGYELDTIISDVPPPRQGGNVRPLWPEEQQRAAEVLLASAPEPPAPPVHVNTYEKRYAAAQDALQKRIENDAERVHKAVRKLMRDQTPNTAFEQDNVLRQLLRGKYLRPNDLLDPWGNEYVFDFSHIGDWGAFAMMSLGPDEKAKTSDDIDAAQHGGLRSGLAKGRFLGQDMVQAQAPPPPPAPMALENDAMVDGGAGGMMMRGRKMAEAMPMAEPEMAMAFADAEAGGGAQAEPPRLREYFPETLLFEPALITDNQGHAVLDLDLADSITTWRMTAMASTRGGVLGSMEKPLRVFQDFFVDLDLPVSLTQNDEVSIPVVLYNYLDTAQDVRLEFETEPWFKLEGEAKQTVRLQPEEVRSMYFPIQVVELGTHRLTVYAYGSEMSDAIRREIEVRPDGEECNIVYSDRLSGRVEQTIDIPAEAVDGASKILVRIYPGVYSQIVEGMDSMLQMPFGCFEQTSAVTYPNILVVQYMRETDQLNAETQMKAEGFINAGYQRLLAYEVDGGGFSWFGDAPANQALTALGVKEFHDMSKVYEVDPAVVDRTRQWLWARQQDDGSWKPDEQYLHAKTWKDLQASEVLVTAYILDALLSTGGHGNGTQKAIDYLRANWKDTEDAYTLALVSNALVSWDAKDSWTRDVLERLHELRVEEDETVHWEGAATVTFTHGDAADVETTALAALAFLRAGRYPEATSKALTYIIRKKGPHGNWGSTQATILALKALMESLGSQTEEVDASIAVKLNGETVSTVDVTPADSDVMRLIDLGEQTREGANTVALELDGEGSMLYQVVGRYYAPWPQRPPREEAMTIRVDYDKTNLAVNDMAEVSVEVVNNRPDTAKMVIVDLGIPPGFQVMTPDIDALVEKDIIEKYEMTGRQVILYFEQIDGNDTVRFSYNVRAKFPLRAKTPASRVYEYYNPDVDSTDAPKQLVVE